MAGSSHPSQTHNTTRLFPIFVGRTFPSLFDPFRHHSASSSDESAGMTSILDKNDGCQQFCHLKTIVWPCRLVIHWDEAVVEAKNLIKMCHSKNAGTVLDLHLPARTPVRKKTKQKTTTMRRWRQRCFSADPRHRAPPTANRHHC